MGYLEYKLSHCNKDIPKYSGLNHIICFSFIRESRCDSWARPSSSLIHASSLSPVSIYCFRLIRVWGGRREGSGKVQIRSSYNRSPPLPRRYGECMSYICGFFRDSLFREYLSTEVPLILGLQLTAYHFPLSLPAPKRSTSHSSKWSSWKDYLLRRTNALLPSPDRPMRIMPLHSVTVSEHVAGSQNSHPL